jgi:outer membrane protein TolC
VDYDHAIYRYNELVLNAVKEVLDGVALVRNYERQLAQAAEMRQFQQRLDEYSELRLGKNLNSHLNTLSSQSDSLSAKDRETMVLGEVLQALLLLIKALGGGYGTC